MLLKNYFRNITKKNYIFNNFGNNIKSLHISKNKDELKLVHVICNTNPNKFGSEHIHDEELETELDIKENNYINSNYSKKKLTIKEYSIDIKNYLNQYKLDDAINVVDICMKNARIKPDRYIFNILICGSARQGQMEQTFKLFQKMKKYGIKPNGATYTSLFNSCANTFLSNDIALIKANYLRNLLHEKNEQINQKTYNAMIKAYGRCNDIQTAFLLVDELLGKNFIITTETFNFLLQACITNKKNGFLYALIVWNKMNKMNCLPDKNSFNLFLRCIRDCSIGNDIKLIKLAIMDLINDENVNLHIVDSNSKNIVNLNEIILENNFKKIVESKKILLNDEISMKSNNNFFLDKIENSTQRLQLIGGFSGYLETMKKNKITPNIKTFTMLLEVIPDNIEAENELLLLLKKIGLKCDIDFFNILIKKRNMRFDYDNAKNVLKLVKETKLKPNISTYGVIALGCKTQDDIDKFLEEIDEKNIKLNIEILGTLLRSRTVRMDFIYIKKILNISLDKELKPNEEFLKHLNEFDKKCFIIQKQQPENTEFLTNFRNYRKNLNSWKQKNGIEGLILSKALHSIKKQCKKYDEDINGMEITKNYKLVNKQKTMKYIKIK